ncbi:MAG: hypothetical protein HC781_14080 [Leptolyngbyaceae cyanobacterium CSU_1_4]|nr:hypothetical protein [Leptolyngbyaceae cyanobacterium CSU_1_4]
MSSPHLRRNFPALQPIKIGLGAAIAAALGLVWNYVSIAALPTDSSAETYSASIPWVQDQAACEKTNRAWHDEQCWDNQHDPSF